MMNSSITSIMLAVFSLAVVLMPVTQAVLDQVDILGTQYIGNEEYDGYGGGRPGPNRGGYSMHQGNNGPYNRGYPTGDTSKGGNYGPFWGGGPGPVKGPFNHGGPGPIKGGYPMGDKPGPHKNGMKPMKDGMNPMKDGMNPMKDGKNPLKDGMKNMMDDKNPMKDGMENMMDGMDPIKDGMKNMMDDMNPMNDGMKNMMDGKNSMKDGMKNMMDGKNPMKDGMDAMKDGMKSMMDKGKDDGSVLDPILGGDTGSPLFDDVDGTLECVEKFLSKLLKTVLGGLKNIIEILTNEKAPGSILHVLKNIVETLKDHELQPIFKTVKKLLEKLLG